MNAASWIIEQISAKCKLKQKAGKLPVTVLGKKTYLDLLADTAAFIDRIYLAITTFPDLFPNQVGSLYTGEK